MEHMHIYSLLLGTLAYIGDGKTISAHACESDLSCELKPDHDNSFADSANGHLERVNGHDEEGSAADRQFTDRHSDNSVIVPRHYFVRKYLLWSLFS